MTNPTPEHEILVNLNWLKMKNYAVSGETRIAIENVTCIKIQNEILFIVDDLTCNPIWNATWKVTESASISVIWLPTGIALMEDVK
jgi:hypothetical protein